MAKKKKRPKFKWKDRDRPQDARLTFGKYLGQRIRDVPIPYLIWARDNAQCLSKSEHTAIVTFLEDIDIIKEDDAMVRKYLELMDKIL